MDRNDSSSVPILDLAPKQKRPLSRWNPLDYLRIMVWAFFSPQLLRLYRNTTRVFVLTFLVSFIAGGVATGIVSSMFSLDPKISIGVLSGISLGFICSIFSAIFEFGVASRILNYVTFYVFIYIMMGMIIGNYFGILSGISAVVIAGVTHLRLESWFLETLRYFINNRNWKVTHGSVTFIPIPSLSRQISRWLEKDWQKGLYNVNQILEHTRQFIPTIQAVNYVLSRTAPTQLLLKISQLATNPFDWELVRFSSVSLSTYLKFRFIDGLILPKFVQQRLLKNLSIEPRLDTPARAVAAGFWYLYKGSLHEAKKAFDLVIDLPYGKEMQALADTLDRCNLSNPSPSLIAVITLPLIPPTPHLRPANWLAIDRFRIIIKDIKIIQSSISPSARSFALNRALAELDNIIKHPDNLDGAEKESILEIARTWHKILLPVISDIRGVDIRKPVQNPYIVGDPVQGSAFVGREDIINQLAELWLVGRSVQSVLLYAHRRMGKTSILRNVRSKMGATVHLAYVNLLLLSNPQGAADVLMFICDEIQQVTGIDAPPNSDFTDFAENTCRRYIQQVCDNLDNQKLIIALDEFEQIENFIRARKINPDFLQFLRGLVQLSPKIAFAFAGLHTLEEMTADYFHPFFASVIPIRVGFLSLGSTRQLLANPDPDFLLDYEPDTLDAIYDLTAGQPYLTQLVGFQLVRHYNNQVFERGRPRDPVFTTIDLQTVIEDPEFFDRGRYYFTGIWQQAAQDTPHQQAILKAIAPAGLTLSELSTHTNLAPADLQPALTILDRHDVICYKNDRYFITVELFRRWVLDRSPVI
jgi:hypothetical protein